MIIQRKYIEELPVITITMSVDEGRALLRQSSGTWLVRRFRQMLKLNT